MAKRGLGKLPQIHPRNLSRQKAKGSREATPFAPVSCLHPSCKTPAAAAPPQSADTELVVRCLPARKIVTTAFKTLLARIRYPNNDPREIYLPARIVVRRSS